MPTTPLPNPLFRDIHWSFTEPVPSSPEAMVMAAEDYAESIEVESPALALRSALPFSSVSVRYKHSVRRPDGEWEDQHHTLQVSSHAGPLTGAALLWELHIAWQATVGSDDHRYFEGLELLDGSLAEPQYELCLGS